MHRQSDSELEEVTRIVSRFISETDYDAASPADHGPGQEEHPGYARHHHAGQRADARPQERHRPGHRSRRQGGKHRSGLRGQVALLGGGLRQRGQGPCAGLCGRPPRGRLPGRHQRDPGGPGRCRAKGRGQRQRADHRGRRGRRDPLPAGGRPLPAGASPWARGIAASCWGISAPQPLRPRC